MSHQRKYTSLSQNQSCSLFQRPSGNVAGVVYGGVGGGVAGGLVILPILATVAMPALGLALFPAWFGGALLGCRALFRRATRKRTTKAHELFELLSDELARLVQPAPE